MSLRLLFSIKFERTRFRRIILTAVQMLSETITSKTLFVQCYSFRQVVTMPLEVKVFRPTKNQFKNTAKLLQDIDNDPDFKRSGLAKVMTYFQTKITVKFET